MRSLSWPHGVADWNAPEELRLDGPHEAPTLDDVRHQRTIRSPRDRGIGGNKAIINHVRTILSQGRIVPYYQPKFDLITGAVVGVEALLRWADRDGRPALPGSIAAVFDDRDLGATLSTRMRDLVLDDIARWNRAGVPYGHVAINTCTADFIGCDFSEIILEALAVRDIDAQSIEIEVTESVVLGLGQEHVQRALENCRKAGLTVSLDDFGTGYASLANLQHLPITALKIDRSFVAGLGNDTEDAIISALALIGRQMGLHTVAEGIEHQEQVEQLIGFGVGQGQGFWYSEALPADEATKFLVSAAASSNSNR